MSDMPMSDPDNTTSAAAIRAASPRDPVEKAVEVLRWMIDGGRAAYGVRELARGMNRPPSTIYRALVRLESQGLVALDSHNGRYSLGLEMFRLAAKVSARFSLPEAAIPVLTSLHEEFNETASLGLLDLHRRELMMIATVESTQALRIVVDVNEWRPLYRGAAALSVLAFVGEEMQEQVLADLSQSEIDSDNDLDPGWIRDFLPKVRQSGYSFTIGQRRPDVVGFAAPIFDPDGVVVGCVGMTLPSSRFDPDREHDFATPVIETAKRVSAELIAAMPGLALAPDPA